MRTSVPSNDSVRPKSLVCCRSCGIGIWTQDAFTDLIFIARTIAVSELSPQLIRCPAGTLPDHTPLSSRRKPGPISPPAKSFGVHINDPTFLSQRCPGHDGPRLSPG